MKSDPKTRRVECHACGAEVVFNLREDFSAPDINCEHCGQRLTDNTLARALGEGLSPQLIAEAWVMVRDYTHDQIIDLARKGFDAPESLTKAEQETLMASVRLRAAGLPSHGVELSN